MTEECTEPNPICEQIANRMKADLPHLETKVVKDEKDPCTCILDFYDKELSARLQLIGKQGGMWSSDGSLLIRRNKLADSDIPTSLAGKRSSHRTADVVFSKGMTRCEVDSVHVHNGGSPAVHLHLTCGDLDTRSGQLNLIDQIRTANKLSREEAFYEHEP